MLGLAEFVETFDAEFTDAARVFHPAKWTGVIIGQRVIDPGRSCLSGFYIDLSQQKYT